MTICPLLQKLLTIAYDNLSYYKIPNANTIAMIAMYITGVTSIGSFFILINIFSFISVCYLNVNFLSKGR